MKLSDADLNLMVAFEALWEERSVSRAADRLGIRQPAMSATLSRLREMLGDPLFTRVGSRMQPTPRAVALAPSVQDALSQLRSILDGARPFVPLQATDVFTLASTDYTTLVILPTLMKTLQAVAPGVDLRVIGYDKSDIEDMLLAGRIDVALGVFQQPAQRAVKQQLCTERFVGVVRLGHPALVSGRMSVDDYCNLPHALASVRRDAVGAVDVALAAIGRKRRVVLSLPHMLVLPAVVRQSDVVATLPARLVGSVACHGLQSFELPFEVAGWNIEILWNPTSRNNEATTWLRRCIEAAAQQA